MKSLIVVLLLLASDTASACSATGMFGIPFGSKPKRGDRKIEGNDATTWFTTTPPEPDPRFHEYRIRVDAKTKEIIEVVAIRTITRKPGRSEPPLPVEQREAGKARALAFALEYLESLPAETRAKLVDKHGINDWQGQPVEGYNFNVMALAAWDVQVSCIDIQREWVVARRVLK
jgi:hypothetical protein